MYISNTLNELIQKQDYSAIKIYINLGFELSLTNLNCDNAFKFGRSRSKLFDYVIENDLHALSKSLNKEKPGWVNDCGYSILQWAIILSKNEIARFLIENGFPITNENNHNENDFLLAARFKNFEILELLIKNHYDQDLIFCRNKNGFNAVHFACSHKSIKAIRSLLPIANNHLLDRNIFGANCLHWLVHGRELSDDIKYTNLLNFIAVLRTSCDNYKKLMQTLISDKNALGFTPTNWLELYNHNKSSKFLKDLT